MEFKYERFSEETIKDMICFQSRKPNVVLEQIKAFGYLPSLNTTVLAQYMRIRTVSQVFNVARRCDYHEIVLSPNHVRLL